MRRASKLPRRGRSRYGKVASFAFLVASLCSGAASEPARGSVTRLGLEESLARAREGNASLLSERLAASVAQERARYSWNAFLPSLTLGGTLRNVHELAGSAPPSRGGTSLEVSAGLSLTLTAGIPEARRQSGLARDAALLSLSNAESVVERDVKTAYYLLLADRDALELAEGDRALANRQAEYVRKNYESGLASELELLQARYAAAANEPKIDEARRAYRQACREFAILLGIEPTGDIELTDTLETNPRPVRLPDPPGSYVERSYSVRSARYALETAKSERRAGLLVQRAPTVSLSESVGVSNLEDGPRAPDYGTFSLSVSIPLNGYIAGSREWLSANERETAVLKAGIALERARRETFLLVQGLVERLEGRYRSIDLAAMNERLAARAYELSGQGYRAGLVTQTEYDGARQRLLEARLAALTAGYNYKIGVIELAHGLGLTEAEVCGGEAGR